MGEKKLDGAGLRGQVAGKTALSTVGKEGKGLTYRGYAIEEWQKKQLLRKLHICSYMANYLINLNSIIIPTNSNLTELYLRN